MADTNLIEDANEVTNRLADWLRDLVDEAEDGVHVAIKNLTPVIGELQRMFSNPKDPLPPGTGDRPA